MPVNPQAKIMKRRQTFCGTLEYMAPEMMKNNKYGEGVDWFSFGILLFEMLSGKNPFKGEQQTVATPSKVPSRMSEILSMEDGEILS